MSKCLCHRYIRYLLSLPQGLDPKQVEASVTKLGLDYPGTAGVREIATEMGERPQPYYPHDLTHKPSRTYLYINAVMPLYELCGDTKLAIQILQQPRQRELLESAVVADLSAAEANAVLLKYGFTSSARACELFRHFFFDVSVCDHTELRAVLMTRGALPELSQDPYVAQNQVTISKLRYRDQRVALSMVNQGPMAKVLFLIQHGIASTVHIKKLVTAARDAAIMRTFDEVVQGASHASERAANFSKVALDLQKLMQEVEDPSADIRTELVATVKTVRGRPPLLSDLARGDTATETTGRDFHDPGLETASETADAYDVEPELFTES